MKYKKNIALATVIILLLLTNCVNATSEINNNLTFKLNTLGNYFFQKDVTQKVELPHHKIQPGSSGYFNIIIDSTDFISDINYNLEFTNVNNKPTNLYFIVDNKKINNLNELSNLKGIVKKRNKKIIKKIYWNWDYQSNEYMNDNSFNGKTINFEIKMNYEKINEFNNKKLPRTGYDLEIFMFIILGFIITIIITIKKYKHKHK